MLQAVIVGPSFGQGHQCVPLGSQTQAGGLHRTSLGRIKAGMTHQHEGHSIGPRRGKPWE